jgi:hypothetical protein
VRTEGFIWACLAWARGKRLHRNQREIRGDHARDGPMLVSVCLEEMTSGAQASVTERERKSNGSGGRGK